MSVFKTYADKPVLWHFAISHFNEKVRWALDYKHIPHTKQIRFLDYSVRNYLATGQIRTPILFHKDLTLIGSSEIIDYLEQHYPEQPLYPADKEQREKVLELQQFFDDQLGPYIRAVAISNLFEKGRDTSADFFAMGATRTEKFMMRSFFPLFTRFYRARHNISKSKLDQDIVKVQQAIDRFELEIGSNKYLVGNQFSVADLTAASLFYPFVFPSQFPYRPPEKTIEGLMSLRNDFETNRLIGWVTEMYHEHRPVSIS